MKLTRTSRSGFEWNLSPEEWRLLQLTLDLFPLVPPNHFELSKTTTAKHLQVDEEWLRESMSTHISELRTTLQALIQQTQAANRPLKSGLRLQLNPADLDRLLQILNNVRVGSWIQLGCPDSPRPNEPEASPSHFLFAMEFCGWIQGHILHALHEPDDLATE